MPVKHTSKYQLSQWEKTDQVLMEDFNTDNLNVENALAGLEASKAKQTDLEALTNTVNTKANQMELEALRTEVAAKAAQTALDTLNTTVTQLSNTLTTTQASVPKIATGSYNGDNQATRFIPLNFTPKAVLVVTEKGQMYANNGGLIYFYGGLALTGLPVRANANLTVLEITNGGFNVSYYGGSSGNNSFSNASNSTFYYIAFG